MIIIPDSQGRLSSKIDASIGLLVNTPQQIIDKLRSKLGLNETGDNRIEVTILYRSSVDEIKDVKQLGNNEALVTFEISDIIKSENYPELNDEEHKFEVTLKVNNNTKYNLNFYGQDTYNAETIENSKGLMLYIRLDANTLNDEYPCISMFDSYSN